MYVYIYVYICVCIYIYTHNIIISVLKSFAIMTFRVIKLSGQRTVRFSCFPLLLSFFKLFPHFDLILLLNC